MAVRVTSTLEEVYHPLLPEVPEVTNAEVIGGTLSMKLAVIVPGPLMVAVAGLDDVGFTVIDPVVPHEDELVTRVGSGGYLKCPSILPNRACRINSSMSRRIDSERHQILNYISSGYRVT